MVEKSTALCADRYHAVMGNFSLGVDPLGMGETLGDMPATFYVTERKIPYAPALGYERMVDLLNRSRADEPRARFLAEDRADLKLIAERLKHSRFPGEVFAVPEGTIVFAGEPIAEVSGPFAMIQMFEVVFEYTYDLPMTLAYLAMQMKEIVGDEIFVSDFSLRRSGDLDRAVEVSKYLYIGGCDDTSNLEAAFLYGIVSVGTMAHYLVQAFMSLVSGAIKMGHKIPESWYDESGNLKHGQRICFEYWLDAHPHGTVCLVDTLSLKLGMIHVIEAALSSRKRRKALRAVRIDSGDLIKGSIFARRMLDANGLNEVKILLTGDLDHRRVESIALGLRDYYKGNIEIENRHVFEGDSPRVLQKALKNMGIMGIAGGTKFTAEIERTAGVIFKLIEFWGQPTLKLSGTPGKETLPGKLQIWRCEDRKGKYMFDVLSLANEAAPEGRGICNATPLIQPFWRHGMYPELRTPNELKRWVAEQKKRFVVPLEEYGKTKVQLSPALSQLKSELQKDYLKAPHTKVKLVKWPR
jgi:nicotinate phosphoribosyltransferase